MVLRSCCCLAPPTCDIGWSVAFSKHLLHLEKANWTLGWLSHVEVYNFVVKYVVQNRCAAANVSSCCMNSYCLDDKVTERDFSAISLGNANRQTGFFVICAHLLIEMRRCLPLGAGDRPPGICCYVCPSPPFSSTCNGLSAECIWGHLSRWISSVICCNFSFWVAAGCYFLAASVRSGHTNSLRDCAILVLVKQLLSGFVA